MTALDERISEADEQALLDSIGRWLDRKVAPVANRYEQADEYPTELVHDMVEMGLFGALIEPKYGGLGLSAIAYSRIVARISEECKIPWVRRPFDLPITPAGGAWTKRATSRALTTVRGRFGRVLARHGCRSTDHFAGFQITGRYTSTDLVRLIGVLPPGTTEFMCHPGVCTAELRSARTRLKESREQELRALTSAEVRAALARHGVELVSYRAL